MPRCEDCENANEEWVKKGIGIDVYDFERCKRCTFYSEFTPRNPRRTER